MRGWPVVLAALMTASGCAAASGTSAGGPGRAAGGPGAVAASAFSTAGGAAGGSTSGTAGGTTGGQANTSSGSSSTPNPLAHSVPVRLQIPDIGVDTPVIGLGLAADGTVQVPPIEAHSPAGWYQGSPTPGQTGPSVLLGHVTVGQYGDGVFRKLDQLHPGSRLSVRLQDGDLADFTVDTVDTVAKNQFPTQKVYGNVNRPELRLITCGGPKTGDGYLDNVVVYASLTGSTGSTAH
jgi:LPXTG-site transpeptidase (sortase) family protein